MNRETVFLFVGEKPSRKAACLGATWRNGGLAAKQLHDALRCAGISPRSQRFLNLFGSNCDGPEIPTRRAMSLLKALRNSGVVVVAMGNKVAAQIGDLAHCSIVHPAARGAIRKKEVYAAHVRNQLTKYLRDQDG